MKPAKLTYGMWEEEPTIIALFATGQMAAQSYKEANKVWAKVPVASAYLNMAILPEHDFEKKFPGIGVPEWEAAFT